MSRAGDGEKKTSEMFRNTFQHNPVKKKSFERLRIDICQEIRDMNWEEF